MKLGRVDRVGRGKRGDECRGIEKEWRGGRKRKEEKGGGREETHTS